MRKIMSNASVNSMDAFLANADLNEMSEVLTFCGDVPTDKLGQGKQTQHYGKQQSMRSSNGEPKYNKFETRKFLKATKLGFKQKFAPKKTVERTISTGTISSTDTGYHSVDSEYDSLSRTSSTSIGKPKRPRSTSKLTNLTDVPRHSTPVIAVRTQKRRADDNETTFNADTALIFENLEQMNEVQGKSVILQRFMADQTLQVSTGLSGNDDCDSPDVKRRQTEVYRFLWENNCNSDCESDISEQCETLDMAFNASEIDYDNTFSSPSRTLRREFAVSNLNRFSQVSRNFDVNTKEMIESKTKAQRRESAISNLDQFSLLSRDIGLDISDESNGLNYSFDCSFPRMDETKSEDFSMEFSCDCENESMCNEDDCMDSFMKTRSLVDISGDVTLSELKEALNKSCFNPDKGFGLISKESVTNCKEPEIFI